jgi:hypothetical protein
MSECGCDKLKDELQKLSKQCDKDLIENADSEERNTALIQLNFMRAIIPIIEKVPRCRCYNADTLLIVRDILEKDREIIIKGDLDPRNIQGRYAVIKAHIFLSS